MDSESSKSAGIIQAIILLANSLGMTIVAEGIETTEQFWQLKALQCEYGQGYFFVKPFGWVALKNYCRVCIDRSHPSTPKNKMLQNLVFAPLGDCWGIADNRRSIHFEG
jgi:hypothetical protein